MPATQEQTDTTENVETTETNNAENDRLQAIQDALAAAREAARAIARNQR